MARGRKRFALDEIPDWYLQARELYAGGWSMDAIGAQLNRSYSQVRRAIHLEKLREQDHRRYKARTHAHRQTQIIEEIDRTLCAIYDNEL